jgi:hypothetical protein
MASAAGGWLRRGVAQLVRRAAVPILASIACGFPQALAREPAAFDDVRLQALLREDPRTGRPVDSLEELLPLLPRALRANFTLVYKSRSPFAASISPRRPRVILFTDDGRFILTFTGDERAPGHDFIETMSFDDQAAAFRLHAYMLPAAQRAPWPAPAHAADCASCHGADVRPIYDSYPLWPGFYGQVLDTFPHDGAGRREAQRYRAFLAGPAKVGVYKFLIFGRGSRVAPYLDPSHIQDGVVELDGKAFPRMPKTRLGMALTELNRARIYRELSAAPGFRDHERDVLAELLECPGGPRPSRSALRNVRSELTRENAERLRRLGGRVSDPDPSVEGMEELRFVRALAEIEHVAARSGADPSGWSMALQPNSLAFYDGILSGSLRGRSYYIKEDFILETLGHLSQRQPAFRPFFEPYQAYSEYGYPFGRRLDLARAAKSCALLRPSPAPAPSPA